MSTHENRGRDSMARRFTRADLRGARGFARVELGHQSMKYGNFYYLLFNGRRADLPRNCRISTYVPTSQVAIRGVSRGLEAMSRRHAPHANKILGCLIMRMWIRWSYEFGILKHFYSSWCNLLLQNFATLLCFLENSKINLSPGWRHPISKIPRNHKIA